MPEDKRITKTRALLRGTLQEMLETLSFDDVKVKQICKKAEVSRVTFYSHFADKYALLHDLYADFLNCAMRRCIDKCRKSGKKDDVVDYMINLYVSYAEELYAGRKPFFRARRVVKLTRVTAISYGYFPTEAFPCRWMVSIKTTASSGVLWKTPVRISTTNSFVV